MVTLDQIQQAFEIVNLEERPPLVRDPIVNWLVDCLTDEFQPYDSKLYTDEIRGYFG